MMLNHILKIFALACMFPTAALALEDLSQFEFPQDPAFRAFDVVSVSPQIVRGTCNECDTISGFMVMLQPDPNDLADKIRYGDVTVEDMSEGSGACVGETECLASKILLSRAYAGFTQETYSESIGFQSQTMLSDGESVLWIVATATTQERASEIHNYLFQQTEPFFGVVE